MTTEMEDASRNKGFLYVSDTSCLYCLFIILVFSIGSKTDDPTRKDIETTDMVHRGLSLLSSVHYVSTSLCKALSVFYHI